MGDWAGQMDKEKAFQTKDRVWVRCQGEKVQGEDQWDSSVLCEWRVVKQREEGQRNRWISYNTGSQEEDFEHCSVNTGKPLKGFNQRNGMTRFPCLQEPYAGCSTET